MNELASILQKIFSLLPFIGGPNLLGNPGIRTTVVSTAINRPSNEAVLAVCRLSDNGKPQTLMVSVGVESPLPPIAINAEYRVQFGNGDIMFDSGFIPFTSGTTFPVHGSVVNLSARATALAAGGVNIPVVIAGLVSLGASPKNIPNASISNLIAAVIPGASTGNLTIPRFARAIRVATYNQPFDLMIGDGSTTIYLLHFDGGMTDWLPIGRGCQYNLTNSGGINTTFYVLFDIEY